MIKYIPFGKKSATFSLDLEGGVGTRELGETLKNDYFLFIFCISIRAKVIFIELIELQYST
jgi:hypothetical protein